MVRVDATVAKAGVYSYTNPDGSVTREYLPAEEIARADSLASLEDVAVTNRHPRNMVDPASWGAVSIGHARNGRADGEGREARASATLVIAKQDAQAKIGTDLVEVSRGVSVRVDNTPGVTPWGEKYDAVQRDVVYNHIAVGPRGWNRQGPDVALRLDAKGDEMAEPDGDEPEGGGPESEREPGKKKPKTDACCAACGSRKDGNGGGRNDAHLPWDECMAKAMKEYDDEETAKKVCGSIKAKNDGGKPQAKGNEMLKYDGHEFKTDAELAAYIDAERGKAAAEKARADAAAGEVAAIQAERAKAARASLESQAKPVLGVAHFDSTETDRSIRARVLAKLSPTVRCDGQSDEYVRAAYDVAIAGAPVAPGANRSDELARKLYGIREDGTRESATTPGEVDYQARSDARQAEIWRKPIGTADLRK